MKTNRFYHFCHTSFVVAFLCISISSSSYGKEAINQTSNAQQSQNIVADTVNISGLAQSQVDSINKNLKLLMEEINKSKKSSEDARKSIENIDKELSIIQREKFDSLPDDSKKWVIEVRAQLNTFQEKNSLIQESLKKQIEYRENLSQQMVVRMRDYFGEIINIIDTRALALQEEKDLVISYTRNQDLRLFVEKKSQSQSFLLGHISFKNGSSVDIILIPGTLVQGIAQHSPELKFFKTIKGQQSHFHVFSFIEKHPGGTITFGPAPLVPELKKNKSFEIIFNPQEKVLSDAIKKEFMSAFTQLIGSVISEDAV